MDPATIMAALLGLFGGGGGAPAPAAPQVQAPPTAPLPPSIAADAVAPTPRPQDAGMGTLGSILQSVQIDDPAVTPLPMTAFADSPRAMNPEFSQAIMKQLMAAGQAGMQPQPSLGALLGGR